MAIQQRGGILVGQTGEAEHLDAGGRERPPGLAHREQHRHGVGVQSPGGEQQRLRGGLIQPLDVIDQAQQGPLRSQLGQQREGGRADQEPVVHRGLGQPERGQQRRRLWSGQRVDTIDERVQQQVQAAEGQLGLGLDPHPADNPHVLGDRPGVIKQDGLPDSRLTRDDQRATPPGSGVRKQPVDAPPLLVTPDDHAQTLATSRPVVASPRDSRPRSGMITKKGQPTSPARRPPGWSPRPRRPARSALAAPVPVPWWPAATQRCRNRPNSPMLRGSRLSPGAG
jgi:hypothetical protein